MGASFSSDGALDAQFAAASQGLPALSTDPPSHPPVRQQLPESIQSGTQPLQRGRACRGRRERGKQERVKDGGKRYWCVGREKEVLNLEAVVGGVQG